MTDKPKRVTKKKMIHGASSDTSKIIFTKDDILSGRMFTNKQIMDCLIEHMNQCIDLESKLKIAREALEMYAKKDNYSINQEGHEMYNVTSIVINKKISWSLAEKTLSLTRLNS